MSVLAGSNASGSGDATISATDAQTVAPSDSAVLSTTRSLYVGTTGNLAVTMLSGSILTFTNVPVGILPIQVTQVRLTNTTASGIIALY